MHEKQTHRKATVFGFLFSVHIFSTVYAKDIQVGDSNGWSTGYDYKSWASSQQFNVGDKLVFNYNFLHGVYEVNKGDYESCTTSNPVDTHSYSPATVTLSAAGTRYFICPSSNHCSTGMKLAVTTVAGSTTLGTPPSESGSPSSTSPTGTSTRPQSSDGSSGSFISVNHLMIRLSLVVATVFGFMG